MCFSAVFVEGIVIFGLFPFVALLLLATGEPRASIAGAVIAGFSVGGVIYAVPVPKLVAHWRTDQLMIGGGIIAALSLCVVAFDFAWPVQFAAFTVLGFGFYTLHGSIQVQATELAPDRARRRDVDAFVLVLHGPRQRAGALQPRLRDLGAAITISIAAAVIAMVGFVCARLLRADGC